MPALSPIFVRVLKVAIRMTIWTAYIALLAPWVTLAIVVHTARKMIALRRMLAVLRFTFARDLPCPAGHWNSLHGVYECRGCGSLFAGYAFDHCPTCGESCGHIPCERCGLAVRNPLL